MSQPQSTEIAPSSEEVADPPDPDAPWIYSSIIEPENEIVIASEVSGRVVEMNLQEGDKVAAGQVLLRVDGTSLEAQRAHALSALQAAQSEIELLQVQASEEEIEAARAEVASAEAAYQQLLDGPTEDELTLAKSQLMLAETEVKRAQAAYDQLAWNPLIASMPENLRLQEAILALETAQSHYEALLEGASKETISQAYAQLASTRAKLQALEDGPEKAKIAAADAQVRQAETALYLAQLQLDKATLRAPVDAIVAQIDLALGDMAAPDTPAILLYATHVKAVIQVEETRMVHLKTGQPAIIRVGAFPSQSFEGTITAIAPQLDSTTRTGRVTVQTTDRNAPLLPGMLVTVELLQSDAE